MATILLADDDPMVRATIRFILVGKGHEVIEVVNGEDAINAFKTLQPGRRISLIITDIMMPRVDGLSLIAELRKIDTRIKILAVTGGGRQLHSNFLAAATNIGANDALKKPFTHHQLLEKVDALLNSAPLAWIAT